MLDRREGRIEPAIMIENRSLTIKIEGGTELFGRATQIHLLAEKAALAIVKRMHPRECALRSIAQPKRRSPRLSPIPGSTGGSPVGSGGPPKHSRFRIH